MTDIAPVAYIYGEPKKLACRGFCDFSKILNNVPKAILQGNLSLVVQLACSLIIPNTKGKTFGILDYYTLFYMTKKLRIQVLPDRAIENEKHRFIKYSQSC